MEEAHEYEDELREALIKKNPKHPALHRYWSSTWKAIEAYEIALYGASAISESE